MTASLFQEYSPARLQVTSVLADGTVYVGATGRPNTGMSALSALSSGGATLTTTNQGQEDVYVARYSAAGG